MPLVLLYWRQVLVGIGIVAVIAALAYVKHVFSERAYYESAYEEKSLQMERMEAGFKAYIQLNEDTQNDLRKQRQKLRDRIAELENSTPPVDGTRFVFMSATSLHPKTGTDNR